MKQLRRHRNIIFIACSLIAGVAYYFCLPATLFHDAYSTVLEDRNGLLLTATIARDGQWRFPENNNVPDKFVKAIIAFEDKRFYDHPGVDVMSLGRAFAQNTSSWKRTSGGSTLSMQTIRLARKNKSRSLPEKFIEIILATRLEFRYSKKEILSLYASHAPFGGNVVGVEAACWRYFGRRPDDLSWGEAALLAVLPNAPSLMHPGKNRGALKTKRDRLLDKLSALGYLDTLSLSLAKMEPIPEQPAALPRHASHLLLRVHADGRSETKTASTIALPLQQRVEEIVEKHHEKLLGNQIHNVAALVLDVETGQALAYVGNVNHRSKNDGNDVDIISSPRSTGSILKPLLYAAMVDEGKILPHALLPDIPTVIGGFSPKNFSHQFDGAVHADKALIRSLNIPAVYMLQDYRYERFHTLLEDMGITTLNYPAEHYGLTLILGGAEATLWDVTGLYASMARTLNHFNAHHGLHKYMGADIHAPVYFVDSTTYYHPDTHRDDNGRISAGAIYLTCDALKDVYRPGEESGWRYFNSAKRIAWKTGTSFGFRDGWAVGITPHYAIGVWVGNADGEGRPGLTGTETAAPILFDILSQLPANDWFGVPTTELIKMATCRLSGDRATDLCLETDTVLTTRAGLTSRPCRFHKLIHVTPDRKQRVNSACVPLDKIVNIPWFVLPPTMEHFYKPLNLSYKPLPPFKPGCQPSAITNMELIYPKAGARIFIPRNLDGKPGAAVFELSHRNPKMEVFWHLDGDYLGRTEGQHKMPVVATGGHHKLTIIDGQGEVIEREIDIISKL